MTTTPMHALAVELRPLIEQKLPKGVRFMLVLTNHEDLGCDGTLPPPDIAHACVRVLETLAQAVGVVVDVERVL